jgi:hypothetical protein
VLFLWFLFGGCISSFGFLGFGRQGEGSEEGYCFFFLRMERRVGEEGVTGTLTVKEIIPADEAIHNNSIPPERKKAMGKYIQSRYERVLTSS